eukprot:CAMPEP_0182888498 /NCGR_PEP_ID=MMETSP0034_2-20130328/21458_1 /TAXON_ID=156128 /ORGANISM="Nephroselmis pyriformis, Strain CCMP717" /LENGTH=274 /DNA_ID=CAMNT_0025021929 /DNA_START=83 /DNA_END=903 /DNA_ORIENTATION=+
MQRTLAAPALAPPRAATAAASRRLPQGAARDGRQRGLSLGAPRLFGGAHFSPTQPTVAMCAAASLLPRPGVESLDEISPTRKVLQKLGGHRTGNDDVIASWFAWAADPAAASVCDLGTGHGSVTLLMSQVMPETRFVGIEIQPVSADLCRRNFSLNGLEARAECLEMDLRSVVDSPHPSCAGGFDVVTGTPPFKPVGSGTLPRDPQRQVSRFEFNGGVEEYCSVAARLVKPGGKVCMVMDANQDGRVRKAFAAAGLRVESTATVYSKPGQKLAR